MAEPKNVLFLCTGNSARSILGEAILNYKGQGRFRAYSAGSHPAAHPKVEALRRLSAEGVPIEGLRSKSWDEFAAADAPKMDFVITVCDNAANEACPYWPGAPLRAHWGQPDPAAVRGTRSELARAYQRVGDVQGGTFTITNPGGFGTFHGTPIISQPQVGILGTYALVKRPWVVQDELGHDVIAIRPLMNITLTYDHRLVDGAYSGGFLRDLRARLEGWETDS